MEDDAGSGEMEGGADSAEGGPGATGAGTAPGLTDVEGKGTGRSMRTEQSILRAKLDEGHVFNTAVQASP